jgi:hypothetical protein
MTDTRHFDLSDILTITTGRLVSTRHIDGVYDILNHMTGESLFTHQLPRACDSCAPALLAQHPQLHALEVPAFDNTDTVEADIAVWLAEQRQQFGTTLSVAVLRSGDYTAMHPLRELGRMAGPEKTITVIVD